MRLRVRVEGREFTVEIDDPTVRPIRASVDGKTFEVWPEESRARPIPAVRTSPASPTRPAARPNADAVPAAGPVVRAPIPGVIASVAVRPGDSVTVGQELCVLEAMKMKNAIRASRPGTVATVHIAPSQHVKHNDPLIEFTA